MNCSSAIVKSHGSCDFVAVEAMMQRLLTLHSRAGMEVPPTDRLVSRLRLDTSPLQFALDDIESYLKREHGERRPNR